ncbi:MAG: heparinase II/III family protein [Planctomycetota bacterium]
MRTPVLRSFCVAAILFCAILHADTIRLRDGTEMKGKIVKRSDAQVSLDMDGLAVDIPMNQIAAINDENIAHPEETKPAEEEKKQTQTGPVKAGKDVAELLARLETKPSPEQIAENAAAKRKVILKPDPERVVNISDETFFNSIDPNHPGMKAILTHAKSKRHDKAWEALDEYIRKNMKAVGELRDVEDYRKRSGNSQPGETDSRADQVCDHVIRVWHVQVVEFGKDMDWTKVEGRSSLYGFHYWGWSSPLWTAYVRTGNEKYAAGFDELFTSWYAQRGKVSAVVPTNDIIWYELGCGGRPIVFAQQYYAMLNSRSLRPETRKLILKTLLGHANQLQAQQVCGYTDGNFQLTASKALYQLGLIFPWFKDAALWRETGTARLLEHAYWDFSKEGGHDERCIGYGSISLRAVRQLLQHAEDDPAPSALLDALREKVLQMQLWFLQYVSPSGVFTGVNDSNFTTADSLLGDFAKFANDGRFLWPIRGSRYMPEGIEPKQPEFVSVHMPDCGWTFMRDGWEKENLYCQVNWGKWGGGHTHSAIFDINIYAFGEPMVIETSRFDSYDNPLEPYFRSPEAHNEVAIEGCTLERKTHQGENIVWRNGKKIDYFEGTHAGYAESAGKIVKRQILFVKGDYWLVIDTILDAEGKKVGETPTATLNWHAPYKWKDSEMGLISRRDGGPGTQLIVLPKGEPKYQTGYEDTIEMYKSRYRAYYSQPAKDGTRFITLIAPFKDKPVLCKMEMLDDGKDSAAVRIVRGDKVDRVIFGSGKRKSIAGGGMDSDARIAWLRERPRAAALVDGSRLTFEKASVLKLKAGTEIGETR